MKRIVAIFCMCLSAGIYCEERANTDALVQSERDKRVATLRYGIEGQVMELLASLTSEKNTDFIPEILSIFDSSVSPKMRASVFDYFSSLQLFEAETRAFAVIQKRDSEADHLVSAAFSYLIKLKSKTGIDEARNILSSNEKRYYSGAIKLIGAAGGEADADALVKAYALDSTDQATKEAIVLALGTMQARSAYELLSSIAKSDESSKAIRMYACTALGDIGDERGVAVLIAAAVSNDPNVRASALSALANFKLPAAQTALREGLRDSHVIPRLAAVKAVGKNRDAEARAFLEYKASFDPEKSVRDAAIISLSLVGGADEFLFKLLADSKAAFIHRANALSAIVSSGTQDTIDKALQVFVKAQGEKDRAFYTALAKALAALETDKALPFMRVMLGDKEHAIRLGVLVWAERNKAKALVPELKGLAESDPVESVRKRAALAAEKLEQ